MLIQENLSIEQKLRILTDAAKYDVACTSSGVDRKGRADGMGSATDIGICPVSYTHLHLKSKNLCARMIPSERKGENLWTENKYGSAEKLPRAGSEPHAFCWCPCLLYTS